MRHTKVKDLLNSTTTLQEVNAKGWVRTFRNNQFIALNDGSTINNIQCVVDFENTPEETLKRITTGAAVSVFGTLVESKGAGQKYEIQVNMAEGDSAEIPAIFEQLSPRQLDVARLVGKGQTNYQIACELGITENTVKLYVSQVLRLTHMHNRTQLALALSPGSSAGRQRVTAH